jgi:hypothetical protein
MMPECVAMGVYYGVLDAPTRPIREFNLFLWVKTLNSLDQAKNALTHQVIEICEDMFVPGCHNTR